MYKKIILTVVLFYTINNVMALELWNGFTTDMTREDVINKAKELYGENNIEIRLNDNKQGRIVNFFFLEDDIGYDIPLPNYHINIRHKQNNSNPAFSVYFKDNKIINMSVSWSAEPNDMLRLATQQFGQPRSIKYKTSWGLDGIVYKWEYRGMDIFLHRSTMVYFDRNIHLNFVEENRRIEQQKKIEEEERRKKAAESVKF